MTEAAAWILIRHWDDFQHPDVRRADRAPIWIRVYTQLLHDDDYLALTWQQRGLLHGLWLEFASSDGQVPLRTVSLTRRLGLTVRMSMLEALNHAGYIEFVASKPLALSKQVAPQKRREEEIYKEQAVKGVVGSTSTQDRNGLPEETEEPYYNLGLEIEIEQLCASLTDKDEGSDQVIRSYAERLPLGVVAKVRESVKGRPAKYAVGALKDELRHRTPLH